MINRREVLSRIWNQWAADASPNGVNRLSTEKSLLTRLLWFTFLLGVNSGMVFHCYITIDEYLNYEVSSKIETSAETVTMPDITICPSGFSSIRFNSLLSDKDKAIYERSKNLWENPFLKEPLINKNTHDIEYITKPGNLFNLQNATWLPQDFIFYCNYLGEQCDFRNFSRTFDPTYLNCYTFRPRERPLRNVEEVLSIQLFNEPKETDDKKMGVFRILVQQENTSLRDPGRYSFKAKPGTHLKVLFQVNTIKKVSTPKARCHGPLEVAYCDAQNKTQSFLYQSYDCFHKRVQSAMEKNCNCSSPLLKCQKADCIWKNCFQIPEVFMNVNEVNYKEFLSKLPWNGHLEVSTMRRTKEEEKQLIIDKKQMKESLASMYVTLKCHEKTIKDYLQRYDDIMKTCQKPCFEKRFDVRVFTHKTQYSDFLKMSSTFYDSTIVEQFKALLNSSTNLMSIAEKNVTEKSGEMLIKHMINMKAMQYRTMGSTVSWNFEGIGNNKYKEYFEKNRKLLTKMDFLLTQAPGDRIVESRAMTFPILIANIGGIMGLWAGISVVSLVEFLEICASLLFALCRCGYKTPRNSPTTRI